jgi:Mrp family chromosome partitioning ATPase
MEQIRQAIERAKGSGLVEAPPLDQAGPAVQPQLRHAGTPGAPHSWGKEVVLNSAHLESKRIIAPNIEDPRSKSFDMLRTQVLQSMEMKSWHVVGVTSPTAGCGKTVVATNLALSIARQPDRSVLLVDMDLQKPQVANYLGLKCDRGLVSVLEGRTDLPNSIIQAHIRKQKIWVLPCEASTLSSSEWIASRSMHALMQDIRQDFRNWTVIFDLPPVLTGDDVLSILPQLDCVLFVAAVGTTTVSEIKEATRHLESTSIVRVVLNKSSDLPATYYSRYANMPVARK